MEINHFWIGLIIFQCVAGDVTGPCTCKYDGNRHIADCSNLALRSINAIVSCVPRETRELSLSRNEITSIPRRIFAQWPSLRSINLDYNKIEYLTNGAFVGLTRLESLSLSYNRLAHNNSVAIGAFKPLQQLRRLSLQGNCNVHVSRCVYPDKPLSLISALQYLHLDGIPNTKFGPGFSRLKHLNYLYLSDDNGFCLLKVLTKDTFSVFKDTPVSHLKIESCEIQELAPNVFRWMHNLTTLIITRCNKLCSDAIENATIGLNETQIQTLKFNYWCKRPPFSPQLVQNNFQSLKTTSLKYLDLGWNNIYYIDPSVIENLPLSIQYISLKENAIITAEFLAKFDRLVNLKKFDGSYQNHFQMSVKLDKYRRRSWEIFNGNENSPNKTNPTINSRSKVVTLSDDDIHLPRNLEILYMNNIKLGYPIPSLRFKANKLRYIRASSCILTAFLGPWIGVHNLQYLDISDNRLKFIHPLSFIDMKNLSFLFLQQNGIGESIIHDKTGETFSSLKKLVQLDLSDNNIKDLPHKIFKGLINLRNLSLADNALKNVSFSLNSMTKLHFLNISGNEIEYISEKNINFLDHIAGIEEIVLDLSNNKLACNCNNLKFIKWLENTIVNIVRKDDLHCLYVNKTSIILSDIAFVRQTLEYECTTWIVVTSCAIGFIGLLLCFSLIALLYYKRWQLRYLWYIGTLKMDPFHHPGDREQNRMHVDAYISYEQHYDVKDDMSLHQFIIDRLYPYLEERGYTIKIREEFDGNERLYKAIPDIVRKCRKVVVFLTPSFCKDYWNTFEFNLAAYEGIYMRRNVIIPVLMTDVCLEDLTPEIRSFVRSKLKSNDVILYPPLVHSIDTFMDQLESRLGR